jgi:hypothetical protein
VRLLHSSHSIIILTSPRVLTVNIKAIDGRTLDIPSGFTVSFNQHLSPPSLLRLETVPDPSATALQVSETWRDPPTRLRIVVNVPEGVEANTAVVSLQDDIRELKALQAELQVLQQAIAQKKKHINSRLRNEANILAEELTDCQGLSCVAKTIADKAHGAWQVLYLHLHPGDGAEDMGRPEQVTFASANVAAQKSGGRIKVEALEVHASESDLEAHTSESEPRPYEAPSNDLPPRPQRQSPHTIALEIALGILCCGCLIAVIRHKCASLRTRTERAADYEERYNARIFKRAARRHAWRNWWRGNWRTKDTARIADYEEKRALINAQENVLESAMQAEIRQLRAAHGLVNDIIHAEEGRRDTPRHFTTPYCTCPQHPTDADADFSLPPPSPTSTYPPTSLPSLPSRPPSRTDSLPSYRSSAPTEPPGYDSDTDSSSGGLVANGFRSYTVAARTRATSLLSSTSAGVSDVGRWTPDSSVVDVSPRPSAETLRRPLSVYTLDAELDECDV